MSDFETIIYEKQGNVGYITLNRPKALNVYNIQMRDDLYQVLSAVKDDPEIKVGVLRAAGEKAFCAGADLTEFLTAPPPTIARQVRWQRDVWGLFLSIDKPMLAALHGYVFGSGIEMALCCDIRIASNDVQLGVPETGLGIIPAAGGTQTLPRTVGRGYALEMLLSGRWIIAEEALRMKLVNQLVPRDDLWPTVDQLAGEIGAQKANMLSYAKQTVTRGLDLTLEHGLELEYRLGINLLKETTQEEAT
jgi:enoyl-CoA hydratase/carnithine racemase